MLDSLQHAEQAYEDMLDNQIIPALLAAERIPDHSRVDGLMVPVRAMSRELKPTDAFYGVLSQLEPQGFEVSYSSIFPTILFPIPVLKIRTKTYRKNYIETSLLGRQRT